MTRNKRYVYNVEGVHPLTAANDQEYQERTGYRYREPGISACFFFILKTHLRHDRCARSLVFHARRGGTTVRVWHSGFIRYGPKKPRVLADEEQ